MTWPTLARCDPQIVIGIDPGAVTGLAVWDAKERRLRDVNSMPIHEAMREVDAERRAGGLRMVVFEDARLRSWFGAAGREKLQGAGSIKRDCAIWADYLADIGVPFKQVKPQKGATKWTAERFRQMTGWTGRCNEHARDAALLVWGMR
jgi:hypothetical protein